MNYGLNFILNLYFEFKHESDECFRFVHPLIFSSVIVKPYSKLMIFVTSEEIDQKTSYKKCLSDGVSTYRH